MHRMLKAVRQAFAGVPEAAAMLQAWPAPVHHRQIPAQTLPVCRWLGAMAGGAAPATALAHVQLMAGSLAWQQTYGAADFGATFLQSYGWSEFIGLRGPVPSDQIACGVLLLGPGAHYPPHAHAAEEVYMPIAGAAEWQRGSDAFAQVPVGQAIHHPAWMPHAMRTGAEPMAALYLWRGGDLAAKSVILP